MRRQRRKPGNILAIPSPTGGYFFGRERREGVVTFYDLRSDRIPEISEIIQAQILFSIPVMDYAIKSVRWFVIGWAPLEPHLDLPIDFFMQDLHTGKFSIYKEGGRIVPATRAEVEGLEREAAWDPEHVEDRLRDHYAGKKNKWVESLRPK